MAASVSGPGRQRMPLAEINVTPLVDVMLVLLIISMLAAPMLQEGMHLELPSADSSEEIDLLVWATGFRVNFPFMDDSYVLDERGWPKLFIHTFHREWDDFFASGAKSLQSPNHAPPDC